MSHHFSRRPRYRLAPPPQRGVAAPPVVEDVVEAPVVEETPVVEAPVVEETPVVEEAPPVVEEVPPVVEEVPPVVEEADVPEPKWNVAMKKADLFAIGLAMGLSLTEENTKAEIVDALRAASA